MCIIMITLERAFWLTREENYRVMLNITDSTDWRHHLDNKDLIIKLDVIAIDHFKQINSTEFIYAFFGSSDGKLLYIPIQFTAQYN